MLALSFAWTTPALLAGEKTCTRRHWVESHARKFRKGRRVLALDKDRRAGGKGVAIIELTEDAKWSDCFPREDWEREGFAWLDAHNHYLLVRGMRASPAALWQDWLIDLPGYWVVRFRVVEYL